VLDVGVSVVQGALGILEESVVGEDVTRDLREQARGGSFVDEVVDPPEGPAVQSQSRTAGVCVVDDEGQVAGGPKAVESEVGGVGVAVRCSLNLCTCMSSTQQSRGSWQLRLKQW
jgi:hypothetical protein